MATPIIQNVTQAWTAGASWLNTYLGNQYSQDTTVFQNNSGAQLYVGDIVIIGNGTSGSFVADPTALGITTTTTASSPLVVGVVGGEPYNPGSSTVTPAQVGGALIPPQSSSWRYSTGTWTSGTATITDSTAVAGDLGKAVYAQDNPASWPSTPGQQSIITAVTAGTSYTVSIAPTQTRASATNYFVGPAEGAVGPAFPGITGYGAGTAVPVVTAGWAYCNIGTNTVAANAVLSTSTTARVAAAVTVTTYVASSPGTFMAVALEAQSAGLGSPDGTTNKVIRCWIQKF